MWADSRSGGRAGLRGRFAALSLTWKVIVVSIALETVIVVLHLGNALLFNSAGFLDFSHNGNFPHWFSSAQFLIAAIAAAITAYFGLENPAVWTGVSVVMTAFSVEAIVQLHEKAEKLKHIGSDLPFLEPLIGIGLLAIFATAVRKLPREPRNLIIAAAVALFIGELTPLIDDHLHFQRHMHDLAVVVEQWSEMLVATFVLGAVAEPTLRAIRGAVRRADGVGADLAAQLAEQIPQVSEAARSSEQTSSIRS